MKRILKTVAVIMIIAMLVPIAHAQTFEEFPLSQYWSDSSDAARTLVEYVTRVTDEHSEAFVPQEDRIAVFDLDGTLMCENYPWCFEYMVFADYVLNNPDYEAPEEIRAVAQEIVDSAWGEKPENMSVRQAAAGAVAYAGMTPGELIDYVRRFKASEAEGFTGMTRGEAWFLPMLEAVDYLRDNRFEIYVVTATERNIVRGIVEGVLDIPPSHVIGTEYGYTATGQGEAQDSSYTFQPTDAVVFDGTYEGENAKMSKVDAIVREIGQQPVLAFGNSSGDVAMLQYTLTGNPYPSAAFMVLADDAEREYGQAESGAKRQGYEDMGFTVISMRDDFATIYPEGVKKAEPKKASGDPAGLDEDVVVLFTSDVHCGVDEGFSYVGLKAIVDAMEAEGNHVMLADNGDSIQGEAIGLMTQGEAIIELMNRIGYDVAIPGNHEFDYGVDRFLDLTEQAGFPYVSCNFNYRGELVFAPYVIREFDGVKLAFVGVTTPEALTSSAPQSFQDDGRFIYGFMQSDDGAALYEAVQNAVDDARAEGADYVFLLAHLGNNGISRPYTYADVIGHTAGIDAVLDGHSHDSDKVVMKNRDGGEVVRQACGTKLGGIGWLRISAADGSVDTGLFTWNNDVSAPRLLGIRNEMSDIVDGTMDSLKSMLDQGVGSSSVELTIYDPYAVDEKGVPVRIIRRAETNLGDLVADAFRARSGADVAVVIGGSIRTGIARGNITMNDALATFPFGNRIYKAEVTGRQILDALEWGARTIPEENSAFLQVSGMSYEIHTYIKSGCRRDENGLFAGVDGEYRVKNVMIGDEPLDPKRVYTLASQDFTLLNHGDGQTAFDGAKAIGQLDEPDYGVLAAYIRENLNGVVGKDYEDPYGQGRIVAVEEPAQ